MHFADIHNHILPCVDDGSQSLEQSIRMLKIAYQEGIRAICLTPHYMPPRYEVPAEDLKRSKELLQKALIQKGIGIRLYLGNEIYYRQSVMEHILNGKALTLADSRYVLVEYNVRESAAQIESSIHELANVGLRPVIAHIERYQSLMGEIKKVENLIDQGAYVQVNAGSIKGIFGHKTARWSKILLKKDLVHFIATDAHNEDGRAPKLSECARYLMKKYGEDYTQLLLWENPCKVIENKFIQE